MTLKRIEAPRTGVSLVFLRRKTPTRMIKPMEEMIGGHVWVDPTEVPTVMHAYEVSSNSDGFRLLEVKEEHIMTPLFFPQSLRVNADADVYAYIETLQTILVKRPWIDSCPQMPYAPVEREKRKAKYDNLAMKSRNKRQKILVKVMNISELLTRRSQFHTAALI
ncbi:hypothetical protein ACTXT7_012964 [Hymenolepis weldensis]